MTSVAHFSTVTWVKVHFQLCKSFHLPPHLGHFNISKNDRTDTYLGLEHYTGAVAVTQGRQHCKSFEIEYYILGSYMMHKECETTKPIPLVTSRLPLP